MLTPEVTSAACERPGDVNGALALQEPDHLRYRVFRRYRDQHVHVVGEQVAFLDAALLLLGELSEHRPKVAPQLGVQRLAAVLRNEDDVVLALPSTVT